MYQNCCHIRLQYLILIISYLVHTLSTCDLVHIVATICYIFSIIPYISYVIIYVPVANILIWTSTCCLGQPHTIVIFVFGLPYISFPLPSLPLFVSGLVKIYICFFMSYILQRKHKYNKWRCQQHACFHSPRYIGSPYLIYKQAITIWLMVILTSTDCVFCLLGFPVLDLT